MKLKIKSIAIYSAFLLTFLGLTSCGDSVEKAPKASVIVEAPIASVPTPTPDIPTVNASSLQNTNFSYETISYSALNQSASATIGLPDETKTVIGNITLALDVIDLAGIEQISLDFSNGNPDILALQICGGVLASCNSDNQADNSNYRLFITGINPHDYAWKNGPNVIKVWVDNLQGERSVAATFTINWQAVVIAQTTAEFTNVVINPTTSEGTADIEIRWTKLPGYLFYNAFISTEPGVNSDNFSILSDGQARLSLVDNSVVFEGIDANQEYYFTVSGVDDGGESAFSTQRSVIDLSRGAPVVIDDIADMDENGGIIINVIGNDSSSNNQLTIVSFTQGQNGRVTDNGDGTLAYQHDGSETTADQFTYKVNNGVSNSATAIVNINIALVNDAPIGVEDEATVNEGETVLIDVKSNDSDEESLNSSLTIINVSNGANGSVVNNNDGTVSYTHNGTESLSDSFSYLVTDGVNNSAPVTVSLTINPLNDTPVANNDSGAVNEGSSVVLNLRSNDSDAESATNTLTITNLTSATNGTVVNNNDGTVTYNHNGSETSVDTFTYTISDGALTSAPANVSITINPVNDAPVITSSMSLSVPEKTPNTTAVYSASASDSESDTLSWSLLDSQNIFVIDSVTGVITVNDNRDLDFETLMPYNLQLTVSDNGTPTENDTILIAFTVSDVNEQPLLTAAPPFRMIAENAQVADAITSISADDPEGDAQIWSIIAGNSDGVFGIDASGNVTVVDITELNYEATIQYVLTIKAEDAAVPAIFSTIDVTVDISDILENQELMFDALFGNNGESSFNTYSYSSEDSIVKTLRQSDGKLVMVVNTFIAGVENIAAIRLHPNGIVDRSYGDNGRKTFKFANKQKATNAIIGATDSIYIVGTEINVSAYPFVIKVDQTGNLDTSFSIDGKFEYLLFPDDTFGVDVNIHGGNGYIYIASEGFSSSIGNVVLKLLRLDTGGNIIALNSDGGAAEFDLFSFNDFYPVELENISTGELVVFGTDFDGELMDANFAAAVLDATDFSQPSITKSTFDIQQTVTASGSSDDKVQTSLRLINDDFIIAGSSKYLQGVNGPDEATLIKVAVSNLAISIDASFAMSGVFTADIDGDAANMSFVESLTFDSADNVTFVAASEAMQNGDDFLSPLYIVEQLTSSGTINGSFSTQAVSGNYAGNVGSDIITDPLSNNLYLASNNGALSNDDVSFQQFLNNGTEILPSYRLINFTSSNESLIDINLLSVLPNRGALWINSYKPIDEGSSSGSISLVTNIGEVDNTINNGKSTLQPANISYGPSLELSDGSIIFTSLDMNTYNLTIHKITTGNNFAPDVNFVPGFGYALVNLPANSTLSDIAYDAFNNQIVISGTEFSSGNLAFLVKLDATDGTLFNGGNFSNGVAPVAIDINAILTFERVIPQSDGRLIGLGNTEQAGFEQPFLVKLTANGDLDTSFNATGYKIFDLGMTSNDLRAIDIVQLSDDSIIFSVNNLTGLTAHLAKVSSVGLLDSSFAGSGVLNMAIGASSTVINDITLDADENIYAVGYATNTDSDNLVVKIISADGSLDSLFNAYTTPGYWMFDEGSTEQFNKVLFDAFSERIVLGSTITGPIGDTDIRINAFNLIQNDN